MTHANPGGGMPETVKARIYGVVFLLVLALALVLTVAMYNRTFSDVVKVKYTSDQAGLQLLEHSDVKIRGLIVGEVRSIEPGPDGGAVMELAIQKDKAKYIPPTSTGRLLPKTLFGEKYIDLSAPAGATGQIKDGAVLVQDKSAVTVEIDQVLNNLMPLLQAVEPAKLNATLNAIATALDGRGDQFGDTMEQLDSLLGQVNPKLKDFLYDIEAAGDVSDVYSSVTPELMRTLRNLTVTSGTIVEKEAAIETLIPVVTDVSQKGSRFMFDNGNKIIGVNIASRAVLKLFATYAPSLPCLVDGMVSLQRDADIAFGGGTRPSSNLYVEIVKPRPPYKKIDKPEANDYRKPRCYGLPNPKVPFPDYVALDGTEDDIWWKKRGLSSLFIQPGGDLTDEELLKAAVAPTLQQDADDVPDFATLLFGPLANGSVVNIK